MSEINNFDVPEAHGTPRIKQFNICTTITQMNYSAKKGVDCRICRCARQCLLRDRVRQENAVLLCGTCANLRN